MAPASGPRSSRTNPSMNSSGPAAELPNQYQNRKQKAADERSKRSAAIRARCMSAPAPLLEPRPPFLGGFLALGVAGIGPGAKIGSLAQPHERVMSRLPGHLFLVRQQVDERALQRQLLAGHQACRGRAHLGAIVFEFFLDFGGLEAGKLLIEQRAGLLLRVAVVARRCRAEGRDHHVALALSQLAENGLEALAPLLARCLREFADGQLGDGLLPWIGWDQRALE